jgi:hypothetical protein
MYKIQIVSIIGTLVLLFNVLNAIRSEKLKIRYAVLWISTCALMLIFSFWKRLIDVIAAAIGIYYPPSVLFLAIFVLLLIIVFHFSVVISQLSERERKLAQQIAVLEERIRESDERKRKASA